jgi:hypothetical protein
MAISSGFRAWANLKLYSFISKCLHSTVVYGGCNSQLAEHIDFCVLHWKQAQAQHSPQLHHAQGADEGACLCSCTLSANVFGTTHKWITSWVVLCEIACEMHVAQLLQTLSSLIAEHTNSSVVG